jgi:hypothetical protein
MPQFVWDGLETAAADHPHVCPLPLFLCLYPCLSPRLHLSPLSVSFLQELRHVVEQPMHLSLSALGPLNASALASRAPVPPLQEEEEGLRCPELMWYDLI